MITLTHNNINTNIMIRQFLESKGKDRNKYNRKKEKI